MVTKIRLDFKGHSKTSEKGSGFEQEVWNYFDLVTEPISSR